jgi:hypothetical protein
MTTTHTNIEYIHSLTEDIGNLKESITLRNTSTPSKLESYTAFNGTGFIQIPPEKVQVIRRTTITTVEVEPVE